MDSKNVVFAGKEDKENADDYSAYRYGHGHEDILPRSNSAEWMLRTRRHQHHFGKKLSPVRHGENVTMCGVVISRISY